MVSDRSPTLDRVFRALAHPARRSILRRLADGERNVSQLAKPFRMTFPALSKHIRVLERARLVRRRVVGRTHLCRIDAGPLQGVAEWTASYRRFWDEKLDRLEALLQALQAEPAGTKRGHE